MQDVQRHPIDYDALNKGDVISVNRLEQILGVKRDHKNYAFRLLRLKGRIEKELHDRKKDWTLSIVKGDLKILTDAEASTYNYVESGHARRKERRTFVRQSAVDINQLPEAQRPEHERRLLIQSRYIQAQNSVRKQIQLESVKRTVPGLPGTTSPSDSKPDSPPSRSP